MGADAFYPDCRPAEGSTPDRIVFHCQPKRVDGNKTWAGSRITEVIMDSGVPIVADDGGIDQRTMDMLVDYLSRHIARR